MNAAGRLSRPVEPHVAAALTVLLGAGTVIALSGTFDTDLPKLAVGGGLAAAALVALITAEWLDGLALVVLSLPLPALFSSAGLRVAPVAGITAIVVLAWTLRRGVESEPTDLSALPRRSVLFLLAAVTVAAVFAAQKGAAIREVINLGFIVGFLAIATAELTGDVRRIRTLAWLLTMLMGMSGAVAALQAVAVLPSAFALPGSAFQRATLGFAWPNDLGMFMALGIPVCVYALQSARTPRLRMLAAACLGGALLGLVASFSRGSWLAVVASTIVLLFTGQRRFVLRIWLAAIAAAAVIEVISGGAIIGRITSQIGGSFFDQRAALTLAGLLMFQAHPVVGVGPGGFGAALDHFGAQIPWLWDYVGSAHNSYVHMAAETGAVGLVALLGFFAGGLLVMMRAARRMHRSPQPGDDLHLMNALLWSFATAAAVALVEWVFAHGIGEQMMLVAAMGFALSRSSAPREPDGGRA